MGQLPTCWEFFCCLQVAKSLTSFKLNNTQKHATTFNRVCKQTQHVTSNTVSSCLPTMLGQSSHGLILHFQNDQSGQPVLTFGEWSPLKSDQDYFLSCHFYHFPLYLTSCKPPLPWLVVLGDSLKTTHLHILGGHLLEVHLHFPSSVDLKYYLIYIYVLYIIW